METSKMIVIGIFALILLGFIYNRLHKHYNYPTTTTTKSVVVKQPVYVNTNNNYRYNQPVAHYNSYKAQYY